MRVRVTLVPVDETVYSECEFVALVTQHAVCVYHVSYIRHWRTCTFYNIFKLYTKYGTHSHGTAMSKEWQKELYPK